MLSPDPATDASTPSADDLAEVAVYDTSRAAFERGLVVLSLGRPFWLVPSADNSKHRLLVEPNAFDAVREQLARYERESVHWPPTPVAAPTHKVDLIGPMLWAAVILATYRAQAEWPRLTTLGAVDAGQIFTHGQVWRAASALFLHASAEHVLANVLTGLFAFTALVTTFGRLRAWTLLAISAVTANLTVAAINFPGPYRSLGASTAIFAALGLMTGRAVRHSFGWRNIALPLATGFVVLALYGAGEHEVDVGAHLVGFLVGLATGFVAGHQGLDRIAEARRSGSAE
jgi:rhomboid protease GluP